MHYAPTRRRRSAGRRAWLRFFTIFPAATLATGCAALQTPEQRTWLALHAVDTAQTLSIVDDPCFREGHPVTRALIGAEPSRESVIAWSVGSAAVHAGVTEWLIRSDRPRAARWWNYLTIGEKAFYTGRNFYLGVRIGGDNKTPAGCTR